MKGCLGRGARKCKGPRVDGKAQQQRDQCGKTLLEGADGVREGKDLGSRTQQTTERTLAFTFSEMELWAQSEQNSGLS